MHALCAARILAFQAYTGGVPYPPRYKEHISLQLKFLANDRVKVFLALAARSVFDKTFRGKTKPNKIQGDDNNAGKNKGNDIRFQGENFMRLDSLLNWNFYER